MSELAGFPFPWTSVVNDGLGLAIKFEEDQYLGTEGRDDREEVKSWQLLSPFPIRVPTTTTAAARSTLDSHSSRSLRPSVLVILRVRSAAHRMG